MKTKLIAGILLSTASICLYAGLGAVHSDASGKPSHDHGAESLIDDNGLPKPGSGIQVIPLSKTSFAKEKGFMANIQSKNKLGYVDESSPEAKFLLRVEKDKYYPGNKSDYENNNPHDTHLKGSLSQIKLAFPFNGLSFLAEENVLGFAAAGGWENGWTGIVEIFLDDSMGICKYTKNNAVLDKSAVILVKEYVTYDINSKPTQISVMGRDNDGFSYRLNWYDNDYYHTLICANKAFNKSYKDKLIELARKIDLD